MPCLMRFLCPQSLEQPQITGRLELFARYGPVDEDGCLRGGIRGGHKISDREIRLMVEANTREALFAASTKPRCTTEVIVDLVLPIAMSHNYTISEVKRMLREVSVDPLGRLDFAASQRVILQAQRQRLKPFLHDSESGRGHGRSPRGPFQSKQAAALTTVMRKTKLSEPEETLCKEKRLHAYSTLVAGMEDQHKGSVLQGNVRLCRDLGKTSDRWDRYCSLRNSGKASYVNARTEPRTPEHMAVGILC